MENNSIYASMFINHGYCEYKFYLQYVLKVKAPVTTAMKIGTDIHQQKEEKFLETAVPVSWRDFLVSKEYSVTKEVSLRTKFENNIILGKVDEIGIDKDGIYIIDDKPRAKLYEGVKMQIFAYCYLFKRNFSDKTAKPIYAVLRDRVSNREVWKEQFNLNNENLLINSINRIKKVLAQEIEPIPTDNKNKCAPCIMHKLKVCPYSLANK
jgi:CRISPR-associated exonuclease Cas4